MPAIIPIQSREVKFRTLVGVNFPEYRSRYPEGLNLKPGERDHDRILKALTNRISDSYDAIKTRHAGWRKLDENTTAYIPLNELEKRVKASDDRKPVQIVIPMTYATLDTLLSFYMSFLEDPIYRYTTEGSTEDIIGTVLLERHVNQQASRFKHPLALHTLARDGFMYGVGAVAPVWTQVEGFKTSRIAENVFGNSVSQRVRERVVQYEGNKLQSIDTYKLLLDPSVSVAAYQDGEYIGWYDRTSKNALLTRERQDSAIFNVKYLKQIDARSGILSLSETGRSTKFGQKDFYDPNNTLTPADVVWMYVDLVPSDEEWQLSRGEANEKWMFGIAGDSIIVAASKLELDHNMFPVVLCAPDYDGHSTTPMGRMEITYGMQQSLDFLFNARLSNLRKLVNMLFAVDPSLINLPDLMDTRDGMIARLRKDAWGRGLLKDAIMPIPVNDFSSNVFGDINFLMSVNDRATAATEQQQGIAQRSRDRVTATEIQALATGSGSKLSKMVQLMFWQYHYDLSYIMAKQTVQLADENIWIELMGPGEEQLRMIYGTEQRIPITPDQLRMGLVQIHDGSNPAMGDATAWTQFLQNASQIPELMQAYDLARIAAQFLRLQGIRNPESMRRKQMPQMQAQVMPDEQVQQQLQAGNILPMRGAVNG